VTGRLPLIGVLLLVGAGWGLTTPLSKIVVSEGYRQFGLIFWQLLVSAVLLQGITWARGMALPRTAPQWRLCLMVALLGTILPGAASYTAAIYLPGGILAILLSTVPLMAFPIALLLGTDRFDRVRCLGLGFGLLCVILIAAPRTSLPDATLAAFIPVALIAPFFYAVEGNVVARWGTHGMDPIQILAVASLLGVPISLILALSLGQWIDPRGPWGAPDWALLISAVIHAVVYTSYVWLIGQGGAVFAAQVAYLVTGFGMAWSIWLLQESYPPTVWAALGAMLFGIFLVQPRRPMPLAPIPALGNNDAEDQGNEQT